MDESHAGLHLRIRRLRRWITTLLVVFLASALPCTLMWGRGGSSFVDYPERWRPSIILLGLLSGTCALLAAFLALRVARLRDRLPRGG